MARKKNPPAPPKGSPGWMATYGDMVTLVLTFFVLLFSFSSIDAEKWKALVGALSGSNMVLDAGDVLIELDDMSAGEDQPSESDSNLPQVSDASDWETIYQELQGMAEELGMEGVEIEVVKTQYEITVRFQDNILFDSGLANLKDEAMPLLDKMIEVVLPNVDYLSNIRIEGHTDNRPINTPRFPNNWVLSQARSAEVLQYLSARYPQIPNNLYFIGGYGEFRPVASNDTAEGQAMNRRVDIVMIRPRPADE